MHFRHATLSDIPQIQSIRRAVKENILLNQALVTDAHCVEYLTKRGKGWVAHDGEKIWGFAIVDLQDNIVWALFIHPDQEKKGIGKQLQKLMLDWYFSQGKKHIWLSTDPNTRAEQFYRKTGWKAQEKLDNGEIKFEMERKDWQR